MGPEGRIALVLGVLSEEEPLSFDEVMARTALQSYGGTAFALGVLEARGEAGRSEDDRFVLKKAAVLDTVRPLRYDAVLEALKQGPATFWEIGERAGTIQLTEVGFALGWLYVEGRLAISHEEVCNPRWCLLSGMERLRRMWRDFRESPALSAMALPFAVTLVLSSLLVAVVGPSEFFEISPWVVIPLAGTVGGVLALMIAQSQRLGRFDEFLSGCMFGISGILPSALVACFLIISTL